MRTKFIQIVHINTSVLGMCVYFPALLNLVFNLRGMHSKTHNYTSVTCQTWSIKNAIFASPDLTENTFWK